MAGGVSGDSAYGQMIVWRTDGNYRVFDTGNITPSSDGRTYTYTYDVDDIKPGDVVEIWANVESSYRNVLYYSNFNVWYDVVQ